LDLGRSESLDGCHGRTALGAEPEIPGSSIKGKVKKKHFSAGRNFSCFTAHSIERDLF
jgi:CRISPR/Cas system CSM-associated protein Csm3 (group 7 of RAMP superfamily)